MTSKLRELTESVKKFFRNFFKFKFSDTVLFTFLLSGFRIFSNSTVKEVAEPKKPENNTSIDDKNLEVVPSKPESRKILKNNEPNLLTLMKRERIVRKTNWSSFPIFEKDWEGAYSARVDKSGKILYQRKEQFSPERYQELVKTQISALDLFKSQA